MSACRELPDIPGPVEMLIEAFSDALVAQGKPESSANLAAKRHVDALLKRLGGGWVYLPSQVDFTREVRNARNRMVMEMIRAGVPFATIITTLKISRATFFRIQRKQQNLTQGPK